MPLAATKVQRKTLILNMSERNRETPSPWNLTNDTKEPSYRKETHGWHTDFQLPEWRVRVWAGLGCGRW